MGQRCCSRCYARHGLWKGGPIVSLFNDVLLDELNKTFNTIALNFDALVKAVAALKVRVDKLEAKVDELTKEE